MTAAAITTKLWNYCHVLRDDGMSYGDYVEQLTYLLFGFGVTSRFARYEPTPQQAGKLACCSSGRFASRLLRRHEPSLKLLNCSFLKMADERTRAPYNQKSPVPEQYSWTSLIKKDGDNLFAHYRHTLEALGKQKGLLGLIFGKSQNKTTATA